MVRTAARTRSIRDAFGHGYCAATDPGLLPRQSDGWRRETAGPLTIALQDRTRWASFTVGRVTAVFFGHPVDLDADTTDLGRICRRAARELERGGVDSFTRHVAYLAGRFTAYAVTPDEVVAVPDTCATQMTFWASRAGELVVGSHVELVASAISAEVDEEALRRLDRLRELNPRKTNYFAGIETAYSGVHPVIANCRARWSRSTRTMTHERFYPFAEIPANDDVDAVFRDFRDVFDQSCRLLASFGRTAISLTAGLDSGTTLRGVLPHLRPGAFTFTYLNVGANQPAHFEDAFVANHLSTVAGLPHRLLKWQPAEPGTVFDRVFSTTWRAHRPSDGAARAMYESLPSDIFQLQSMHAEVGTVFYKRRTREEPSPARLALLYQGPAVAKLRDYVEQFEKFIEYADFHPGRFAGLDYHDLFYWEHRDSRWAAQKPHEGDLGHRVLQPFNNRRLLEIMHRLPYGDRQGKVLLHRMQQGNLKALRRRPSRRERLVRRIERSLTQP